MSWLRRISATLRPCLSVRFRSFLVKRDCGLKLSFFLDYFSNNLYWSDSEHGTIEVLSLNQKYRTTVHHYSGMAKPIAIAVIPENG